DAENQKYEYGVRLSLQSLAILSYTRGDYRLSNRQAKELITKLSPQEDLSLLANMYNLVGVNYQKLLVLDSALVNHQQSLLLRRQSKNESRIASSLANIASVYLEQYNGGKALPYLLEA
ncbi:MAG: hypothetical protein ACKO96_30430, partial [Flammeovirgaceae bacterium]